MVSAVFLATGAVVCYVARYWKSHRSQSN
jgi:hypothetical protein